MRRVVVTGLGMVTPLGMGVEHNWTQLLNGVSGIGLIDKFDVSDLPCKIGGEVPRGTGPGQFNVDDYLEPKDQRKNDEFIHFAMAAAAEAVKHSGYVPADEEAQERTGVMIGSGIGGLPMIYETSLLLAEKGPRRVSPFFIPASLINLASARSPSNTATRAPTTPP